MTTSDVSVAEASGVLVLDKPAGLTSQQAVTRAKRVLGVRKVGHAGTLDPMATGVLVLGLNRATRLLGYIAGKDKQYVATIRLGLSTSTDDAEGEPLGDPMVATTLDDVTIAAAAAQFVGNIEQVPSAVSAIKVNGKRAYARVRAGERVELAARRVQVDRFEITGRMDDGLFVDLNVIVDCSTGTYIRALARDLGRALGVGGHLTMLRRTRVGRFELGQAVNIDEVSWDALVDLPTVAALSFSTIRVTTALAVDVTHGRALPLVVPADPTAILGSDTGDLLALYRPDDERSVPVAVLVPPNHGKEVA